MKITNANNNKSPYGIKIREYVQLLHTGKFHYQHKKNSSMMTLEEVFCEWLITNLIWPPRPTDSNP